MIAQATSPAKRQVSLAAAIVPYDKIESGWQAITDAVTKERFIRMLQTMGHIFGCFFLVQGKTEKIFFFVFNQKIVNHFEKLRITFLGQIAMA